MALQVCFSLVICLWLSVVVCDVTGYCYTTDPDPYRFYTTETRYDVVLETKNSTHLNTSEITGCEPTVFYLVARHGSRYPNSDTITKMADILPGFQGDVTSSGMMPCQEDIDAIGAWQMRFNDSNGLQLAPTGADEMREMAQRYSQSFPGLLTGDYNESWYEFLHTEAERTQDSAKAFAEGLFGTSDGVEITELPKEGDWLLFFYENCQRYIDSLPPKEEIYKNFREGPEIRETMERIQNRTGIAVDDPETLDLLHDSCSFEYQVFGEAPWCASFIQEDLEVYEYAEDLQYHWTDGYGDPLNYEQTCELMKDIVRYLRLEEEGEDPGYRVLTRFAHSGALNMLYARLGLYNDGYNLTDSGYETSKDRMWRASLINPMSANIVFVRYECTDGNDKVAVYANEQLITLPVEGCEGGICPVSALQKAWLPITTTCDVNEICAPPTSSAAKIAISFTAILLAFLSIFA